MPAITLVQRQKGQASRKVSYHDKEFEESAGITVDSDTYTPSLDRIYDTKGLERMHIFLENPHGVNPCHFKIEKCRIEYTDINQLTDADFNQELVTETIIAALSSHPNLDIVDISPETTALRMRYKRATAGQDTLIRGVVSTD